MLTFGKLLLALIFPLAQASNYSVGGGGGGTVPGPMVGGTLGSVLFIKPNDTVAQNNSSFFWDDTTKTLKLAQTALASTPVSSFLLQNSTAATAGVQQVSPALEWLSRGWKTSGTPASQLVNFRAYSLPIQAAINPEGVFKIQSSINGASFSDLLDLYIKDPTGNPGGRLDFAGASKFSFTHSNQDPGTSRAIDLNNVSGQYSNIGFTFAGTQKAGITVSNTGFMSFKQVNNGSGYYFMAGGAISSQSLMTQIYSGGIYVNGGGYHSDRVTAGSADTTPPATLNSFGSTAVGYELVTESSKTLDATHTNVYCDPSTSSCGGTPTQTACTTYSATNQATCEGHLPCLWTAEVTTLCSTAGDNTDQSTCESQNAACTWTSESCSVANNDSTACAALGYPSGGQCSFTPASCTDWSNTDQGTCEANSGCTWADPDCTGTYGGPDGVCATNYFTGGCSGSWVSTPSSCTGTVACSPYSSEGSCNGEAGCLWQALTNITLPTTATTLDGTTSRIYNIMHVGDSGTVQINPNTAQDFLNYTILNLRKKGDTAEVQLVANTPSCSTILTESPCNAQSPCSWTAAVVCSALGDESSCSAASGSGCSWDGFVCSGAGSPAVCGGGNYTAYNRWMPIKYERAPSFVSKTAAYTLTNEDDTVTWTSGTVNATLPSAVTVLAGKEFTLKNMGSGIITILTTSSQTIDGNASGSLSLNNGDSMTVQTTGTNWIIK